MAVRRLLLIRHGQYDEREEGTHDLTAMGRDQARRIGRALKNERIDAVYSSTMLRARTTAAIIAEERQLLVQSTPLLCECIPTSVALAIPRATIRKGRAQADRAFLRFFRPSRVRRTELVVCHANIIRYLVCKALELPVTRWQRLAIFHASVTEFRIQPAGRAILFAYNDVGHLPKKLRTMSAARPRFLKR